MADTALELEKSAWIDGMESVKGTHLNPIVGLCKNCGSKVYEHQAILSDYNDYCNEDCLNAYEDKLATRLRQLTK